VSIAATACAVYWGSLGYPYLLDDIPAVVDNEAAHWPPDLRKVFGSNYWGNREGYESLTIYRPLATLSFALADGAHGPEDGPSWGNRARGGAAFQRAVNIGLHAGCSVLVFLIALAAFRRKTDVPGTGRIEWAAFLAGLLFAVHPVHTEAVIGVVSRAELLAAFFVLLGALIWMSSPATRPGTWARGGGGVLAFALATLSKESGFTALGVYVVIDAARALAGRAGNSHRTPPSPSMGGGENLAQPSPARREGRAVSGTAYASMAVLFILYMLLRSHVLSGVLAGNLSPADNPIAAADTLGRVLSPFKVFFWYLRLLAVPVGLTIDYSADHFRVVTNLFDPQALGGLFAMAGLAFAALATIVRDRGVSILLLSFLATYSVVSNIPFLSTVVMAERLVYLPSAFFVAAVVGAGLRWAEAALGRGERGRAVGRETARPEDAGNAAQEQHAGRRALPFLPAAATLAVCAVFGWAAVSRSQDWSSAMSLYSAAVDAAPDSAKSRHLLANELVAEGRIEESLQHYRIAIEHDPTNFVARTNFARALSSLDRFDEALEQLREALTLHPRYRPAFKTVCDIFKRTGRPPAARKYCR